MTCKEAERLVIPYIHHQLDDDTMSEFLEHIEVCPNCKEELEIYYTVEAGIRQLDKDTGHFMECRILPILRDFTPMRCMGSSILCLRS